MVGRPDFSQAGSQGSGQVIAVSNRPEVKTVDASDATTVVAGNTRSVEVYAPTGSIYRLLQPYMQADGIGSATTGTHSLTIRGAQLAFGQTTKGQSSYADQVRFQFSNWLDSTDSNFPQPASASAAVAALSNIRATENEPILIKYRNDTDADQTSGITSKLAVEEESY